jgi:hypothetical protein
MNPLEEGLNERLEQLTLRSGRNGHQAGGFIRSAPTSEHDSQIEELTVLARRLRNAPQVQVAPDFARQLERRLLRRHAELRLQQGNRRRSLFVLLRARPALSAVVGLCVLVCLLGTSLLALATQVSNPANPLYAIRRWEQHVQVQFSGSQANQATLDLQFAREQLNELPSLAEQGHAGAYQEALLDLDQQMNTASATIEALPAGAQRDQLTGELATLKSDAIHTLRGLLARLALAERLATTGELGRLGDTVPMLTHATLTLPAHPNGYATISLQGKNIQAGAQLLVNGKPVEASETIQQGRVVFVADWKGEQHPQSLGILNPDDTAAQTTAITITGGSSNGTQGGNGNKPSVTPTPHGNKPDVTPTPHGNKPGVTPPARH